MADNVIRKACDRCHAQKLSCKRINDEPCERCVRLKAECRSSPSLRYKKQQHPSQNVNQIQSQSQSQSQSQNQNPSNKNQNHSQNNHHQPHQLSTAETPPAGRRSPKRRRTDSDSSLVPPETGPIVPHTGGLPSKSHLVVTPDPVLELGDFNFNFDQLAFFAPGQSEHLSHPGIPSSVGDLHPRLAFTDSWDPRLGSSSEAYPAVAPNLHPQPDLHQLQHIVPQVLQSGQGCVPEHSSSDKRPRHRTRQRSRQISLRQSTSSTPQTREAPLVHWMAQLSDINARLLDLSSALPSQPEIAHNGPLSSRPTNERVNDQGFPIDEMFKLTRQVAEILEQPSSGTSENNGSMARSSNVDSSDPGNCMFILSTYVRLLDMYQRVFRLVYTELSQTESGGMFRFWKLPDVTIGSFAVESSAYLQMSLTIQLAEEFLSRLRKATAALDIESQTEATGNNFSFAGVVGISFQAVKEQEQALAKHLVELRGEIEVLLDT